MNGPFGVDISRATDLTPSTSPARAPTSLQIGYSAARAGDVTTKYQRDLGPIFTNLIKKLPFFQVFGHVPARHKPTVASSAPAPTPPQFDRARPPFQRFPNFGNPAPISTPVQTLHRNVPPRLHPILDTNPQSEIRNPQSKNAAAGANAAHGKRRSGRSESSTPRLLAIIAQANSSLKHASTKQFEGSNHAGKFSLSTR